MKLWYDDIRLPPDGTWHWARTNDEAELFLLAFDVHECSLDHDMGLHEADPYMPDADLQRGFDPDNDGLKLVKWMVERNIVPPKVSIHSMNPVGAANMAAYLHSAIKHEIIKPVQVVVCAYVPKPKLPIEFCDTCGHQLEIVGHTGIGGSLVKCGCTSGV